MANFLIVCPECKNDLSFDEMKKGDVKECQFCGVELEILDATDPKNVGFEMLEEEK